MPGGDRETIIDRMKSYPVEPFDRSTHIYPYYVIFEKDGVKVRVPIGLERNMAQVVKKNAPSFLKKLGETLSNAYPGLTTESASTLSDVVPEETYILISDISKENEMTLEGTKSSVDSSFFDTTSRFLQEFKRIRCFYGLLYEDVSQSMTRLYRDTVSASLLYQMETSLLVTWKHSRELNLMRRWAADVKVPRKRTLLFPFDQLQRSFQTRFEETLKGKSTAHTEEEVEVLEKVYTKDKNPRTRGLIQLKEQTGLSLRKLQRWFTERALLDKGGEDVEDQRKSLHTTES